MTGLFRRLAQGMVGPAPPRARAMASLPYVAPGEPWLEKTVELTAPDRQTGGVEPQAATKAPRVGAETADVAASNAAPSAARPVARSAAAAPAAGGPPELAKAREVSGPEGDGSVTAPGTGETGGGSRQANEHADASEPPPPMFPLKPSLPAEPRRQPPLTVVATVRETEPSVAADTDPEDHATGFIETGDRVSSKAEVPLAGPEPLMARTPQKPPMPTSTRPQRLGSDGRESLPSQVGADVGEAAPAGGAPEVHVHIGRVEVTAVRESAAPPRRARRGRQPMSLDEYLSKRRRGTS